MRRTFGYLAALAALTASAASAAWVVSGTGPVNGRAVDLPGTPSGVTVKATSCTLLDLTATISWNAASGADRYEVARTTAGLTTTTTTSATSTTDVLPLGSLTTYRVTALRSTWRGTASASVGVPASC